MTGPQPCPQSTFNATEEKIRRISKTRQLGRIQLHSMISPVPVNNDLWMIGLNHKPASRHHNHYTTGQKTGPQQQEVKFQEEILRKFQDNFRTLLSASRGSRPRKMHVFLCS